MIGQTTAASSSGARDAEKKAAGLSERGEQERLLWKRNHCMFVVLTGNYTSVDWPRTFTYVND